MSEKLPLLIHSNAPWAGTGYAQQTALFAPRLADHYSTTISAFYGLEGSVIPWQGIPVLPGFSNEYGNATIDDHAGLAFGERTDGLILTLLDVWVLDPAVWSKYAVASWVPVDHSPAPDPVSNFFHNSGAVPIAMAKFGQEQLRNAGLDPLYVPHGIDTEAFRPIPKAEAREAVGLPEDAFLVGMFAANKGNPSRKCFVEAFLAFKRFQDDHPDARLYLHTEATGRFDGVNLPQALAAVGLDPESVIYCDQYRAVHFPFPTETMAQLYSSMDVLLAPSAGEGFGIPVVEAQACGTPVIVSDFSAQPELVGAGWKVGGTPWLTPIGSWQVRPRVEGIVEALKSAHATSPAERQENSEKARAKAEEYDVGRVLREFMLPALQEARDRFDARRPTRLKVAA